MDDVDPRCAAGIRGPLSEQQAAWLMQLQDSLVRFGRSCSPAEAELIADETIDRLHRDRPDLLGTREGRAVAFAIAHHVEVDRVRAGKALDWRRARALTDIGPVPARGITLTEERDDDECRRRAIRATFWRTLRCLMRTADRQLLRCLRRGLQSNKEIAVGLGVCVRAVQKARKQLVRKGDLAWKRALEK